jgi:Eco57I restriction-modification methylase
MTPPLTAQRLVTDLVLTSSSKVLEPSFGEGGFLMPLIERLMAAHSGASRKRFEAVMTDNLHAVELDAALYDKTIKMIEARWGPLPAGHHLVLGDYFQTSFLGGFDLIIGNPPFGGTFDRHMEDTLDRRFGMYQGHKLKKETYSFFVAKAIEELGVRGRLRFICSDTFLTIKTMRGLRELLVDSGKVIVSGLKGEFEQTTQPMVVIDLEGGPPASAVSVRGSRLSRRAMESTPNLSWGLSSELVPYFGGPLLGELIVATGGMTIGKNELFVRAIQDDNTIVEPYEFEFFDRPITLEGEVARARLNHLSPRQEQRVREQERLRETRRAVEAVKQAVARPIRLPHPDYALYNKASSQRVYAPASHVIYWRNKGDAVLTFKRDGPWYLHGVGGAPFFGREGLTWQLVAARINARYLPAGYILDSGAPCAFLRDGVDESELFVILAWLQTTLATRLLKQVINHTRNIQGKDIERLPYPHWTSAADRACAAELVRAVVHRAARGTPPSETVANALDELFVMPFDLSQVA